VADNGIKYNRFNSTALCSPTRAALTVCVHKRSQQPAHCSKLEGESSLTPRDHSNQVKLDYDYGDGGVGRGGDYTLSVDGHSIGFGSVERTVPYVFSVDETCYRQAQVMANA
jgi:hypothetical protein